ncbi:MAG: hypothetical protein WDM85_00010 [Caulobacteraceae bacterium]
MPELLLALDVGTTSLGAGVFSPDGKLLGMVVAAAEDHVAGAWSLGAGRERHLGGQR